jgi:putative tryptophan/tyrosine transport system substrate-binding protein
MTTYIARREFIAVFTGAAAWPLTGLAEQRANPARIGVLMGRSADDPEGKKQARALQQGLEELGWSPRRNVEIEYRWPAGNAGQAEAHAKELVDLRPDILIANSTPSLLAARRATPTIRRSSISLSWCQPNRRRVGTRMRSCSRIGQSAKV